MNEPAVAGNPSAFAKLIAFLSGKKTYLVGIAGIVYAAGVQLWKWPNEPAVWGALGCTGALTIRAAIKKLCLQVSNDPALNDAPAEAARRIAGPGVPAIILAASLFFVGGCATNQIAKSPAGAAVISKVGNSVIDKGLNAGATRLDTGNPYLHSLAVGLRSVEGNALTSDDVKKIAADFGDPANAHKFQTLALDVWNVIAGAAGKIGWAAATELAAQTLQNSAADPTPPSP